MHAPTPNNPAMSEQESYFQKCFVVDTLLQNYSWDKQEIPKYPHDQRKLFLSNDIRVRRM